MTTCRSTHMFSAHIYSNCLYTVGVFFNLISPCCSLGWHQHETCPDARQTQVSSRVCVKIVRVCVHVKSSSALFPASSLSTASLIVVSSCDNAPSLSTLISEFGPGESIQALAGTAPVSLHACQH